MYHEDDAQVPALVGGGVVHVVRTPCNHHTKKMTKISTIGCTIRGDSKITGLASELITRVVGQLE